MRALTIWQPYASLVITGTKTIETRSRPTHIRGTIAIHAAKVKKSPYQLGYTPLETLKLHETLQPYCNLGHSMFELPHGMMLGTAELVDCFKIVEAYDNTAILENGRQISGDEFLFGDYRAGRYAWILKKPQPFETPVPAKGGQGWWNWKKPEEMECIKNEQ